MFFDQRTCAQRTRSLEGKLQPVCPPTSALHRLLLHAQIIYIHMCNPFEYSILAESGPANPNQPDRFRRPMH